MVDSLIHWFWEKQSSVWNIYDTDPRGLFEYLTNKQIIMFMFNQAGVAGMMID